MPDRDRARALHAFPALRAIEPQLALYEQLLCRWQQRVNLVSASTLPELWWRHYADSIQLLPHLPRSLASLVDLGSGAGFPGVVLALALQPQGIPVTLIESDQRKAAFLREVSRETGAGAAVETMRVENYISAEPAPDVVTSRAFAQPAQLCAIVAPWLRAGTRGVFLAGREAPELFPRNLHTRVVPSRTGPGFVVELRQAESESL